MSVRSFHSVFMASAVAGAALGCYLVSLRVASERAALDKVETQIVLAQRDIRVLQTEIGTRARLAQLERWNVRVLALSAPTADQILGDKFQLARLVSPERKPAIEAPVVLASAPAAQQQQALEQALPQVTGAAPAQLLHEASVKVAPRPVEVQPARKAEPKPAAATAVAVEKKTPASKPVAAEKKVAAAKPAANEKKAGDNKRKPSATAMTRPVRTANVDPLAPLPAETSAKGSRTNR